MPFPKLSQLQSRFTVSFGATLLLILLYLAVSRPQFAYAAELDSSLLSSAYQPRWLTEEGFELGDIVPDVTTGSTSKEDLGTRAADGVSSLHNNAPQNKNIAIGETQNWVFEWTAITGPHGETGVGLPVTPDSAADGTDEGPFRRELRKRQTGAESIYISLNVCLQPASNSTGIPTQLRVFYSTSGEQLTPGVIAGTEVDVEGGYALIQLNVTTDVYIGIAGPNDTSLSGSWNYEIAASNDAPYHSWSNGSDLLFVDGDDRAALLITSDLVDDVATNSTVFEQWMALDPPPYGMFAHSQANQSVLGVSRSYCGLLNNAKIKTNIMGVTNNNVAAITDRGLGGMPKEQFYVSALEPNQTYWGFMAMSGNSTAQGNGVVGGGGKVWTNMTFDTKANDNCKLMYNLSFCSEVAYAVPSNPNLFGPPDGFANLVSTYDDYAATMYQNFNWSLQQIPCNTTDSAQYSLARNCDDCARAYKQWLCAVTIPRCEDWDNPAPYLVPRAMAQNFVNGTTPSWVKDPTPEQQNMLNLVQYNSSRNSQIIDTIVQPGPYKEVMPCIDLCYDLVQSCPAALGFFCPRGKYLDMSYGFRSPDSGVISCSYLGAAYYLSESPNLVHLAVLNKSGWTSLVITILVLIL